MMKYILIFLGNFAFSEKCDDVVEYTTKMHPNTTRTIPDEYIEEMRYWIGYHFNRFNDVQTYPDNWGCHNRKIISFIFKDRYCELSEMFDDTDTYMSIRIYPTAYCY